MIGSITSPTNFTAPKNRASSALDALPDVSAIEARAQGDVATITSEVATPQGKTKTSKAILAAVTLATAAAALTGAAPAEAHGWGYRGGYYGGGYYRPPGRPLPVQPIVPPKYGKPPDLYKVPAAPRGVR